MAPSSINKARQGSSSSSSSNTSLMLPFWSYWMRQNRSLWPPISLYTITITHSHSRCSKMVSESQYPIPLGQTSSTSRLTAAFFVRQDTSSREQDSHEGMMWQQ
jgi:hypothetical protein